MRMKKLSLEEIELGRAKALANASALVEEAKLLFAAERYPRCYALAHLACEELGKVMMLASIGIESRLGTANWSKFWKRFRSHKAKTRNILGLDYLVSPIGSDNSDVERYWKDITEHVHMFEDLKLACLYSDYIKGNFFSPNEIIKRHHAESFLKLAEGRLRVISNVEKVTLGKIKDVDIEEIKRIRKTLFGL
jgi:AbiV family abortive infection protein